MERSSLRLVNFNEENSLSTDANLKKMRGFIYFTKFFANIDNILLCINYTAFFCDRYMMYYPFSENYG